MAWAFLGAVVPGEEWQYIAAPLTSRLIRLTYFGDADYLKRYFPRAYFRLRIGPNSENIGRWQTLWPKSGEEEIYELSPITIAPNFFDIRKRRSFKSLAANYTVTIHEYRAEPYLISYETALFTVDGTPYTIGGVPYQINP